MESAEGITIGLPTLVLVGVIAALFARRAWLRRRRRQSYHRREDGTHVWIDLDGTPQSSRDDPRDSWDSSGDGGDGGGDGGGGDGGGD